MPPSIALAKRSHFHWTLPVWQTPLTFDSTSAGRRARRMVIVSLSVIFRSNLFSLKKPCSYLVHHQTRWKMDVAHVHGCRPSTRRTMNCQRGSHAQQRSPFPCSLLAQRPSWLSIARSFCVETATTSATSTMPTVLMWSTRTQKADGENAAISPMPIVFRLVQCRLYNFFDNFFHSKHNFRI